MSRILATLLLLAAMLFPIMAGAFMSMLAGSVPTAAVEIARQLDRQLLMRYADYDRSIPRSDRVAATRAGIMVIGTTIVDLNDLETSSPLGRQMTEEITRWMVNAGYRFQELRRGSAVRFKKGRGEFLLSRNVKELSRQTAVGQVAMVGTYVSSGENVRFTVRLVHPDTNEVIAMGTATVPITRDLAPMLMDKPIMPGSGIRPSTLTTLQ
jgi:TolB-like protein